MKRYLIPLLLAVLLVGCQLPPMPTVVPTATPSNIVDRWFFVESQLMRIHFQLNLDTGDYDVQGFLADVPEDGDEVLQTQYDLMFIYEHYGYYEMNAYDHVMGAMERQNVESVKETRRLNRKPWHRTGNLYQQ